MYKYNKIKNKTINTLLFPHLNHTEHLTFIRLIISTKPLMMNNLRHIISLTFIIGQHMLHQVQHILRYKCQTLPLFKQVRYPTIDQIFITLVNLSVRSGIWHSTNGHGKEYNAQ